MSNIWPGVGLLIFVILQRRYIYNPDHCTTAKRKTVFCTSIYIIYMFLCARLPTNIINVAAWIDKIVTYHNYWSNKIFNRARKYQIAIQSIPLLYKRDMNSGIIVVENLNEKKIGFKNLYWSDWRNRTPRDLKTRPPDWKPDARHLVK